MAEEAEKRWLPWVLLFAVGAGIAVGLGAEFLTEPVPEPEPPPPQRLPAIRELAALPPPKAEEAVVNVDLEARRARMNAQPTEPEPEIPVLRVRDRGVVPKEVFRIEGGTIPETAWGDVTFNPTFKGQPIHAPVVIDGRYRGNSPLVLQLPKGDHQIRIDYAPTRVNQFATHIEGGRKVQLRIGLRALDELVPKHQSEKVDMSDPRYRD